MVDPRDAYSMTPVMYASKGNHANAAALLCDYGANVSHHFIHLFALISRKPRMWLSHLSSMTRRHLSRCTFRAYPSWFLLYLCREGDPQDLVFVRAVVL